MFALNYYLKGSNQKTPDTVSIRSEFSVDIVDSGVSFSNQRSSSSIFGKINTLFYI